MARVPAPLLGHSGFWNHSTDLLAEFDAELRPVDINPAAQEVFTAAGGGKGDVFRAMVGDEVADGLEPSLQQVITWGQTVRVDCPMRSPRGIRVFDLVIFPIWGANGRVKSACLLGRDVTESRSQQRKVERILKDYAEISSDILWEWDAEGRITEIDFRVKDRSMPDLAQVRGQYFWQMLPIAEAERVLRWWRHLIRHPKSFRDFEVEFRAQDGETRWYRMSGIPLFDEFVGFCGFRGTAADISQRKREQEDLVEAREAALAASEFKSRFLANMSHEIRTPMNAVIGLS
ncbi:MAG TPA: PAS domain-containing protein, partial [Bdellovibrionota bacterium]|nr:PAS domain-containing protein [Bdellovibrionota bacterium]